MRECCDLCLAAVRVVRIGGDHSQFSLELCGGTHVQNTKEVYPFYITSESAVGAGVRSGCQLTSSSWLRVSGQAG
jgi:alanyl-tRNA synthetase